MQELERYRKLVNQIEDKGCILASKPQEYVNSFVTYDNNAKEYYLNMQGGQHGDFKKSDKDREKKHICATYFTTNEGKPVVKVFERPIGIIYDNDNIRHILGFSSDLYDARYDKHRLHEKMSKTQAKDYIDKTSDVKLNDSVNGSELNDDDEDFTLLNDEPTDDFIRFKEKIGHNLSRKYGNGSNKVDDAFLTNAKEDYTERFKKNNNKKLIHNEFQIKPISYEDIEKVHIEGLFLNYADCKNKEIIYVKAASIKQKVEKYILVLTDDGFRVLDKKDFVEKNQKNLEKFFLTIDEAVEKEKITKESFYACSDKANDVVKISEGKPFKLINEKGNHSFFSRANLKKTLGSVVHYNKKTFQHTKQR